MALQLIRNNIINVVADAIVNTANPAVAVGPGVDEAIYTAAGWDRLLEARSAIGPMKPGEVACTPAFDLDAKHIIHAIGPAWRGGGYGERETVAECYRKSLTLARELGCESIAFPLMATGTYGFPKDEALTIAIREITGFLAGNEMEVLLVVYDKESFEVSGRLFTDIKSYIEEPEIRAVEEVRASYCNEVSRSLLDRRRRDAERVPKASERSLFKRRREEEADDFEALESIESFDESKSIGSAFGSVVPAESEDLRAPEEPQMSFPTEKMSLEERLKHLDKTFQEYLFMLIDRKGFEDTEVYKKANIDRKHFSKIRSNKDYKPSKKTALALAIALELGLDETRDLLSRAGLALSPSSTFDKIVEYCIDKGEYDIYEINCVLFKYDQDTLGA
jgi:O-acetyl-ADP-ribose deacetylase (regulator of RNase III)